MPRIGAALLTVALPVPMAALIPPVVSRAMVKVGPLLFCRTPRLGSPIMFPEPAVVEEEFVIVPSSTRLLRLVPIVPVPA